MIIIVSGLPGSGKSYFAEKLAALLDAAYINSDQVRQLMHATGKYSMRDKMTVYEEMARQTRQLINQKRSVIIDATFYRQVMRELFTHLSKDQHTSIHFIEVVADEELIRERLSKPRKFSEADYSVYKKLREEFQALPMPHLKLQSTDKNITSMLNTAIQYLLT